MHSSHQTNERQLRRSKDGRIDGILLGHHLVSFVALADLYSDEALAAARDDIADQLEKWPADDYEEEENEMYRAAMMFLEKKIAMSRVGETYDS